MLEPPYHFSLSSQAWKGASLGVFIATLMLIGISTIDLLQNHVSLGDAAIYFFVGSSITAVMGALLVYFFILIDHISLLSKWAIACFSVIVYYFFIPIETSTGLILIGIWTIISFSLTCGSLCSLIANKQASKKDRFITFSGLLIGVFGIACLTFWLSSEATFFSAPQFIESKKIEPIALLDPALSGSFTVNTLTYGHGTDRLRSEYGKNAVLITKSVNGTPFIFGWNRISGWLRTRYWGFDPSNLPLNGQVWYPEGQGPFPLVLIVHGNHEMSSPSDRGYAYLASLLASRGFIAVTIDQNFLNSGWVDFTGSLNEVAGRGWLILEHLKLWRQWNELADSPFANKIDMEKIALIGHSRGGEAIATATAFNDLNYYPGDGNVVFDYHFNIRALIAIAPVDAQYVPGGKKIILNNIDYLVIQGAHDGDVRSFQGLAQYNRIHFNDSKYHFKASLYVFGANHGQFNTLWGQKDIQPPASLLFKLSQFLQEKDQRQIAKVYISAFLEAVFHDEKGYLPLFHDWRAGRAWLPKTLYFNEFTDSRESFIMSDKKSIDLSQTTVPGGMIKGEHLKVWRQKQVILREGNAIHAGTFLGWDASFANEIPSYTITLTQNEPPVSAKSTLVFSLADSGYSDRKEEENRYNEKQEPIDFTIELVDKKGEKASLLLSHDAFLQPAITLHLMASDFLDPLAASESIFQTFEFKLQDFMDENPHFDPTSLQTISLLFNQTAPRLIILNSISIRND